MGKQGAAIAYEPSRAERRIAEWLKAMGQGGLAKDVLAGAHWEWDPNDPQHHRKDSRK